MRWGGHPPPPKRAFPQFGGVSFYFFPVFPRRPHNGLFFRRRYGRVSWKTETDMETDTETGTKKGTGTGTEKEKEEKS